MKVEVYKKPSCPLNIANRGRGPFHRIFSTSSPRHLSVHPLPLVRLHTSNGGWGGHAVHDQRNKGTSGPLPEPTMRRGAVSSATGHKENRLYNLTRLLSE